MHHSLIILRFLLFIGTLVISARAESDNIEQLLIPARNVAIGMGFKVVDAMLDNKASLIQKDEYLSLEGAVIRNPDYVVENWESLSQNPTDAGLLFLCMWSAGDKSYLNFLLKLITLTEQNKMRPQELIWAILPGAAPEKWLVVSDNRHDPRVLHMLERARVIFKDNPDDLAKIEDIMSGEWGRSVNNTRVRQAEEKRLMREYQETQRKQGSQPVVAAKPDSTPSKKGWFLGLGVVAALFGGLIWALRGSRSRAAN